MSATGLTGGLVLVFACGGNLRGLLLRLELGLRFPLHGPDFLAPLLDIVTPLEEIMTQLPEGNRLDSAKETCLIPRACCASQDSGQGYLPSVRNADERPDSSPQNGFDLFCQVRNRTNQHHLRLKIARSVAAIHQQLRTATRTSPPTPKSGSISWAARHGRPSRRCWSTRPRRRCGSG